MFLGHWMKELLYVTLIVVMCSPWVRNYYECF